MHVQEAGTHGKMNSNNVTISDLAPSSLVGTSLSLAVSISVCLLNLSLSLSLLLLSLSSLLAINSTPRLFVQLIVASVFVKSQGVRLTNHRVCYINCWACDARTININYQPVWGSPCMLRKLSGMQRSYHQHQLLICVGLAQAHPNYVFIITSLMLLFSLIICNSSFIIKEILRTIKGCLYISRYV